MEADKAGIIILLGVGLLLGVLSTFGVALIITPSEEPINVKERAVEQVSIQNIGTLERGDLIRFFHDDKRNVTCWVWAIGIGRGGISCIPDHMLTP